MSLCRIRPFGVSAATDDTPRSNSGWWTTSICAPDASAASATASVQSRATATRDTGSFGSPQINPTLSHSSASSGG
jgi:hypothetical protein